MGTTVIGGMTAASGIGIFLAAAIFYLVEKVSGATARQSVPFVPPEPVPGEGD
jgi:HAE1 family hydrophobic/amphiphilic exporter-1